MFSLSLAPRLARQSCYDPVRLLDRTSAHRLEGKGGGEDPSRCTIYIVKVQRSAQGLKIGDPKTAKGNRFKIFGISNAVDLRQFLAVPMAVPCTKYKVLCTIEGIISDQPCKVFVISFPCILRTSKSKPRVWYIFEFPVHRTSAHALATSRRQCFYSPKNENACKRIIAQGLCWRVRNQLRGSDLHSSRCMMRSLVHQPDLTISATLRCIPCTLEI